MPKDFRNRKVKFFVIQRKNIEVPQLNLHQERTYDMFDIEQKMWAEFANRGTNDYGYMNRATPKVQLGWSHLIGRQEDLFEFDIHKLSDVLNEVDKITAINFKTPFILLSDVIKDSMHLGKQIETEVNDNNEEIYREKLLITNDNLNEAKLDETVDNIDVSKDQEEIDKKVKDEIVKEINKWNNNDSSSMVVTKYNTNSSKQEEEEKTIPAKVKLNVNAKKIEKII